MKLSAWCVLRELCLMHRRKNVMKSLKFFYGWVKWLSPWNGKAKNEKKNHFQADSSWAIGAMGLGLIGICITVFVIGIFLRWNRNRIKYLENWFFFLQNRHNNTPIVRASGRELSYVLLAGILMCYLETFTLVLKPTNFVCGLQR